MKIYNHPNWLVPLDIARKLTEIGMTNSEILVCNDEYYGWYKAEQMYYIDRDGDTYTALEVSEDSNLEPTYTWEQVFEWFREKGFNSSISSGYSEFYKNNEGSKKPTLFYEYNIGNFDIGDVIFIVAYNNLQSSRVYFKTYEEARLE